MDKTYQKIFIKLSITLLLIAYLVINADWSLMKETIAGIQLFPFIGSYIVLLICSIPLALRLRTLMGPTVLKFRLRQLIQIQFISEFYSVLLPSGVGVSLARWYKITRNKLGRRVFILVTLIERGMLATTLLLCTGIPLLFVKNEALQLFRSSALPVIFILLFICLLFFSLFLNTAVYQKWSIIMRWIQSRFSSELVQKFLGIYEDCGLYIDKRHLLIKAFIFNLIYQVLTFMRLYLIFVALSVDLPAITILWISMLVFLIMNLPISIGGLGVRESGFAWLLVLYNIEPERGALIGGIVSIQMFMNTAIGAVFNMLETKHPAENIE